MYRIWYRICKKYKFNFIYLHFLIWWKNEARNDDEIRERRDDSDETWKWCIQCVNTGSKPVAQKYPVSLDASFLHKSIYYREFSFFPNFLRFFFSHLFSNFSLWEIWDVHFRFRYTYITWNFIELRTTLYLLRYDELFCREQCFFFRYTIAFFVKSTYRESNVLFSWKIRFLPLYPFR